MGNRKLFMRRAALASALLLTLTASFCDHNDTPVTGQPATPSKAQDYVAPTNSQPKVGAATAGPNDYLVLRAKVELLEDNIPRADRLKWWQRFLTLLDKESRLFAVYANVDGTKVPLAILSYDEILGGPTTKLSEDDNLRIKDLFVPSRTADTNISIEVVSNRSRDTSYVTAVVKAATAALSAVGPTSGAAAVLSLVGSAKKSEIDKANSNIDKALSHSVVGSKTTHISPANLRAGVLPVIEFFDAPPSDSSRKPVVRVSITREIYPTLFRDSEDSTKLSFKDTDPYYLKNYSAFSAVDGSGVVNYLSPLKYIDRVDAQWRRKLEVPSREAYTDVCVGVFGTFSDILTQRDVAVILWAFLNTHPGSLKPANDDMQRCPSTQIYNAMTEVGLSLPGGAPADGAGPVVNWEERKAILTNIGTKLKSKLSIRNNLAKNIVVRQDVAILPGIAVSEDSVTMDKLDGILLGQDVSYFGGYDKNARPAAIPVVQMVIGKNSVLATFQFNSFNQIDRIDLAMAPASG